MDVDVLIVLSAYPELAGRTAIQPLAGAGGFSGARLWKVATPRGEYCVRCWPDEQPTRERLLWIHEILRRMKACGFNRVAAPLIHRRLGTIWDQGGHRWEAAPWLPGTADYEVDPRPERLRAAMRALAEFHVVAAKCEPTDESQPAPGVQQRHSQLRTWLGGRLDALAPHVAFPDSTGSGTSPLNASPLSSDDELPAVARQILACVPAVAQNILASLTSSLTIRVPLQPCLRDIWHDHVLFQGDLVTGLIDYGAMRRETVAADIARLLGSFVGDDAHGWQIGLDEYHTIRPLSPAERSLVATFDLSSVVLAPLNWLQWLYLDGRVFEDRSALLKRLRGWAGRLRRLTERMDRQFHIPSGRISP